MGAQDGHLARPAAVFLGPTAAGPGSPLPLGSLRELPGVPAPGRPSWPSTEQWLHLQLPLQGLGFPARPSFLLLREIAFSHLLLCLLGLLFPNSFDVNRSGRSSMAAAGLRVDTAREGQPVPHPQTVPRPHPPHSCCLTASACPTMRRAYQGPRPPACAMPRAVSSHSCNVAPSAHPAASLWVRSPQLLAPPQRIVQMSGAWVGF